jgi:hypothetical protein
VTVLFKDTNSVVSTASVKGFLVLTLARGPEYFKLSVDEWMEFTILGLTTIMLRLLLSFHYFENLGHRLRQHFEQQQ